MSCTKRLKQWFKRSAKSGNQPESLEYTSLPFRDWFTIKAPPEHTATKDSPFFRLPLEIRQKVLGHAFGEQTVHIDLRVDHDHEWQWFSCVCSRRLVCADEQGQLSRRAGMEPCEDACIPGGRILGKRGQQLASDHPSSDCCHLGVMGWLLACRQAYIEGTDVLYRTNTFHISSLPLLLHLHQLLPPHHLRSVTSLELLWTFTTPTLLNDRTMAATWSTAQLGTSSPPSSTSRRQRGDNPFLDLCAALPETFPNVRHLYIALQAHIAPPHPVAAAPSEEVVAAVERVILAPVEAVFRRLLEMDMDVDVGVGRDEKKKRELSLAIQRGGWQVFSEVLQRRDGRVRPMRGAFADGSCQERLWKPLHMVGDSEVVGGEVGTGEGAGYWLRPGWNDFEVFGREYWMFDLWGTGGFKGEF